MQFFLEHFIKGDLIVAPGKWKIGFWVKVGVKLFGVVRDVIGIIRK